MSLSSGIGIEIYGDCDFFFNEEMGLVIEINRGDSLKVEKILTKRNVLYETIGITNGRNNIVFSNHNSIIFDKKIDYFRYLWSKRSLEMELEQNNKECVEQEKASILNGIRLKYIIDESILLRLKNLQKNNFVRDIKVAILRDEGSNGDKEMSVAFYEVGFDVYNISMEDLINGKISLEEFRGIVFVGGFSYSDVLGAGNGWKLVIENNMILKKQFDDFYGRMDTFSLGICNGCQVMSRLGYLGDIQMLHNKSGKFESRFNMVKIEKNNSIFLENLEGMIFGIWSSHGEGRIANKSGKCNYPIKYVNTKGIPTEEYPLNPNGSIGGVCGFSSKCGRHLAMMPHPERSIFNYQIPYIDKDNLSNRSKYYPWILMFRNAYNWCHGS